MHYQNSHAEYEYDLRNLQLSEDQVQGIDYDRNINLRFISRTSISAIESERNSESSTVLTTQSIIVAALDANKQWVPRVFKRDINARIIVKVPATKKSPVVIKLLS